MPEYFVSLAFMKPTNMEVVLEAANEDEACRIALRKWAEGDTDDFEEKEIEGTDPTDFQEDWGPVEAGKEAATSGVFVIES